MRETSIDLRQRVVAARIEDGQSMGEISERFRLAKGTVQNILERYRDSGSVERLPQNAGPNPKVSQEQIARLEEEVLRKSDSTLAELRENSGLSVSVVSVHKMLRKLGFTRKKNCYMRVSSEEQM